MLKKIWFMFVFVLWSFLMVSGCSDKQTENVECKAVLEVEISETDVAEVESDVSVEDDVDVIGNYDTSAETERIEISETEEQGEDVSNVEVSTTTAPSEPETVVTQPTTPLAETQPTTPAQPTQTPSTESSATEDSVPPATDDRGNPADGSPVFEITFNIPQAEYVGYDADRVARLAVEKCKAAGMIPLPENLDNLLAEGKITQEEYNEYYPYDGCGYYSVFVETNLNLASTISGERLCSEEGVTLNTYTHLQFEDALEEMKKVVG